MHVLLQKCKTVGFVVILLFTLSACHEYMFNNPLPADKENLYQFPDGLVGFWIDTEDNEEKDGWYFVNKSSCGFVEFKTEKILAGAWPKYENGKYIESPWFKAVQRIEYDSLNSPVDTVDTYFFRGGLVYEINDDGKLSKGYHYSKVQDTINILKVDTTHFDLGKNVFLRQVDQQRYVLNFRNGWNGENVGWFTLFIIEKMANGNVRLWNVADKMDEHPSLIYHSSDYYYLDSHFTAKQVQQLISDGYFDHADAVLVKMKTKPVVPAIGK